jgi:hypothetical protein
MFTKIPSLKHENYIRGTVNTTKHMHAVTSRNLPVDDSSCLEQDSCVKFTLDQVRKSETPCSGAYVCKYRLCAKFNPTKAECPDSFQYVGRQASNINTQCLGGTTTCNMDAPFIFNDEWCVFADPGTTVNFAIREGDGYCSRENTQRVFTKQYGSTNVDWTCKHNGGEVSCDWYRYFLLVLTNRSINNIYFCKKVYLWK